MHSRATARTVVGHTCSSSAPMSTPKNFSGCRRASLRILYMHDEYVGSSRHSQTVTRTTAN